MKIRSIAEFEIREDADLLIVPFWEGMLTHSIDAQLHKAVKLPLESGDFRGKHSETLLLYSATDRESRTLLLGLGKQEKITQELLRKALGAATKVCLTKRIKSVNVILPQSHSLDGKAVFSSVCEGILFANYAFNQLKGTSLHENPTILLEKVTCIGFSSDDSSTAKEIIRRSEILAQGIYYIRDLVSGNADDVTPKMLAESAAQLAKHSPRLKTTIFDKKWLKQEKMGLLLAVNRASSLDPFLIQVEYKGAPHSQEHIVLVGKGVTYDTGGLSIKPTDGMLTMKCDMAGAATVLGIVKTAEALGLKINVTAVAPVTENCIGSKSYKLGDVYRSYLGKTVEITNTDAEGRLILADALAYVVKQLHPTTVIDLATLTGGVIIALGEEIAALFSNHESLAQELLLSSRKTGELLWQLPLHDDYKEWMKSDVADLVNSGNREASSMKGALFLQEFVGSARWAHLDIAGTAYLSKPHHYNPTKATGYGLRLLIDYLTNLQE